MNDDMARDRAGGGALACMTVGGRLSGKKGALFSRACE
jgi:hypothetical protein